MNTTPFHNEVVAWSSDDRTHERLALASTLSVALSLALLYLAVKLSLPSLATFGAILWLAVIALHVWLAIAQRSYVSELRQFLHDRWGTAEVVELRWLRTRVDHLARGTIWAWVVAAVISSVLFAIRSTYELPELIAIFSIHMLVSAAQAASQIASRRTIRREIENVRHVHPACRISV